MSKRITSLTAEQEAMLPQVREEWLERCLACRPGDHRAAEAALAGAYQAAGLAPPRLYLWARNPMEGVEMLGGMAVAGDPIARSVARVLGGQVVGQVDGRVRSEVGVQVERQVGDQVERQVASQIRSEVRSEVERQVGDQVECQVASQVASQIRSEVRSQVDRQVRSEVDSQVVRQVERQVRGQVDRQVGIQVRSEVRSQVRSEVVRQVDRQVGSEVAGQVDDQVRSQVERQVVDQVGGHVANRVRIKVASEVGSEVRSEVRRQVASQVDRQVGSEVGEKVRSQVGGQVDRQVVGQVDRQVVGQVDRQVVGQVRNEVAGQVDRRVRARNERFAAVKDLWWRRLWGQYDGWLSYYGAMDRLGVGCTALRPLMGLAGHAGWCWVMPEVAILVERHTVLHRDPEGRLHCEDGPAIGWAGWSLYAWHGTVVPAEWIASPDQLTPETALTWTNAEQRLAALQIVTWERVVAHLDPEIIDEDPDPKFGTLLRCDLPGAPASQFLRARCGTGRIVVIPVASDCTTAIEAGARSYGLTPEQYREIEVRT